MHEFPKVMKVNYKALINGFRPYIDGKNFFKYFFIKTKDINATFKISQVFFKHNSNNKSIFEFLKKNDEY